MGWECWSGLLVAITVVTVPLLPRPRTARWRRFRLLGWILLPTTALTWVGFVELDPAGAAWLYYPAFILVLGLTTAILLAGYICIAERKASQDRGPAEQDATADGGA